MADSRSYLRFLMLVGIMLSAAIVLAGGDWLLGYRAFVPLVPVMALLAMESCRYLTFPMHRRYLLFAVALCYVGIQFIDKDNLNARMGRTWVPDVLRPIGEELAKRYGKTQPLMAVFTAGAIPYYSGLPTLDVYGLNDAHLTAHRHELRDFGHGTVGHELFDADYIKSRKPGLLVFDIPGITPQCSLWPRECEKLYPDYEPLRLDIPGHRVTVWQRKAGP
jgi:hypothetical protein